MDSCIKSGRGYVYLCYKVWFKDNYATTKTEQTINKFWERQKLNDVEYAARQEFKRDLQRDVIDASTGSIQGNYFKFWNKHPQKNFVKPKIFH